MSGLSYVAASVLILSLFCRTSYGGTSCPSFQEILPCYCTTGNQGSGTIITCFGIDNSSQLLESTKSMKGLVVDKFLLLGSFLKQRVDVNGTNELVSEPNERERLPGKWLSFLRVKDLEIRHSSLSSCFMCDEPLAGQRDFLVSLSVTHSSLDGHLCNTCNSRTQSVSLRELSKVPGLKLLDLSWNDIEFIDGLAFPPGMNELTKVILSNNKIKTIHDDAFATLLTLTDLDLSNNQLTAISRRTFKSGSPLQNLDLSWNSLKFLPEEIFNDLTNLKELKVNYNLIEVLPDTTWSKIQSTMQKIDLNGNFLVCNSSMSWMIRLPRSTKLNAKCAYPADVESQEIKSWLTGLRGTRP